MRVRGTERRQGVRRLRRRAWRLPGRAGLAVWAVLLAGSAAGAADLPVDLELVLAVDVSGSIDAEEARQQREGYVAAIADPAVVQAIGANFHRRIAVAYLEWASGDYQQVVLDWSLIEDAASAGAFAARLAAPPRRTARWTSISSAIDAAVPLFDGNGYAGERRVIDVSGDGPNNRGRPVRERATTPWRRASSSTACPSSTTGRSRSTCRRRWPWPWTATMPTTSSAGPARSSCRPRTSPISATRS